MKRSFILIGALATFSGFVYGQESIKPSILNSSGGSAVKGTTHWDWSVGEVALVNTFSAPTIIVTQGLLQNEYFTPVETKENTLGSQIAVFPNPGVSIVNVSFTATSAGILAYRLMDITGKVVLNHSGEVKQGVTTEQLNIAELAAATYMLEVSFKAAGEQEQTTTYKIEKLK